MSAKREVLFLLILLYCSAHAYSQNWSGIIAPTRAVDWSQAGIPGGIPSGSWTQCGPTISAYNGTAATINGALNHTGTGYTGCGTNSYVLLGSGTFNLSTTVDFNGTSHSALRGAGANNTILHFTNNGNCSGAANYPALVCITSSNTTYFATPPPTVYNVTAGLSQGSNLLTLSGTSGIVANQTILAVDQDNTGYTGPGTPTGCAIDNSQVFVTDEEYETSSCNNPHGGTSEGSSNLSRTRRNQLQLALVTAVNSTTGVVTISPGLAAANWASGLSPQAWFYQPIVQSGIENLTIDGSALTTESGLVFGNGYQVWVSGVEFNKVYRYPVHSLQCLQCEVVNNYFYATQSVDPYGIFQAIDSFGLYQNNIFQQVGAPIVFGGPMAGTVVGYNFCVHNNSGNTYMKQGIWNHGIGGQYFLFEGNQCNLTTDDIHGSTQFGTFFRNGPLGTDTGCTGGLCGTATNGIQVNFGGRYMNFIGNVVGRTDYHTTYKDTSSNSSTADIISGWGNTAVSPPLPEDSLVTSTGMFWGNVPACTGGTGCGSAQFNSSEVPRGISPYPNSVPGNDTLPSSFYLSSKPSWFSNLAYPPIGPDVTSGNLRVCTGGTYPWGVTTGSGCTGGSATNSQAGFANANPAMNCYLNVMSGAPDGTGSALTFNASICYPASSTPPPTSLTGTVH